MGARVLRKQTLTKSAAVEGYASFDQLDGQHPWMQAIPEGYVPYKVRELRQGEIAYFNFRLAKEMGLIPADHPHEITSELKNKLLSTFSLQIINEYDELTKRKIDPTTIKKNHYMASRYLQLQHRNRQGKTSGDGRGIWNGVVEHRGKVWDVSSRGTGVTCLSPGAVAAQKPLKTGGDEYGYGCGKAEIDELYAASIQAEIMHLQGIATERVLCIIDLGKGFGIGVRAGPNLLRPAHLFMYLKQNRLEDLKRGMEYLLDREIRNGNWKPKARGSARYEEYVEELSKKFANFVATLDIDYIFAWLDWDGDNVLVTAGIIDYGSIRQFGIRHDKYRYDDIERFSTNLNEQRHKAKMMIQVFVQIADYLKTGKKKSLKDFAKHPIVAKFNTHFAKARAHRLLYRLGFNQIQRENILAVPDLFEKFDKVHSYFERAKISGNLQKVTDGVNHPALFNMRNIHKSLPEFFTKNGVDAEMVEAAFFKTIMSGFAKTRDLKQRSKHIEHIQKYQALYKSLLTAASGKQTPNAILKGITERAQLLNRDDRITGNALIQIVDELLTEIKKGMTFTQTQAMVDQLVLSYMGMPEVPLSRYFQSKPQLVVRPDLYSRILSLVQDHKEDI